MEDYAHDDFHQLRLRFLDPIQEEYEVIRPVVLFAERIAERSRQTGIPRTTVSDTARRFVKQGMVGLIERQRPHGGRKAHVFPDRVASYILYLKQVYPPIHFREIVRILAKKFGYTTNHHTVKRFLATHPIPVQLPLEVKLFHQFEDAYQARWTVVRMHIEGWETKSIAGYLQLSRRHVGRILAAFDQDGFAGLEDQRTRPPDHPHNQLTLPLMQEVREIQREYARLGRFRVHGLLEQRLHQQGKPIASEATVGRAMALNRQFHAAPGPWPPQRTPSERTEPPKPLPYLPTMPHDYWFVDVRYIAKLDGKWVYSICVLEGYSRKILAGMVSPYQDVVAVLQLLCAALTEYGRPQGVVSDNGGAFSALDYKNFLTALDIEHCPIEKGHPWQNLIEVQFLI